MKRISSRRVVLFICVMSATALLVYLPHLKRGQFQFIQLSQTKSVIQKPQTPVPIDPYAGFSIEAQQVIASEIVHTDETLFAHQFTVKCLSAHQSTRKFSGYGVDTQVVVVTARFRLAEIPVSANSPKWAKTYDVSETIDSAQFQGLTDADTVDRVVKSLKEQVQRDNESVSILLTKSHNE